MCEWLKEHIQTLFFDTIPHTHANMQIYVHKLLYRLNYCGKYTMLHLLQTAAQKSNVEEMLHSLMVCL